MGLTEKNVARRKNQRTTVLPGKLREAYDVDTLWVGEDICYSIRRRKTQPERTVFYLYDSHFCYSMTDKEWRYVLHLADMLSAALFIPIYPLAPEKGCREVYQFLIPVYKQIFNKSKEDIILVGSGTGGLLSLSLSQLVWKEGLRKPDQLLLLTPVLDTEFFDVEERERVKNLLRKKKKIRDHEKNMDFLNRYWVKDEAGRVEYTSPIYGDFTDFCDKVTVVSGTEDISNGSARLLCDKIQNTGIPVRFLEYTGKDRGFFLKEKDRTSRLLDRTLKDLLLGTRSEIINEYMAEVKRHAQWSKEYPELFRDENALKYAARHSISVKKYKKDSPFASLASAAGMHAFDEEVKLFLRAYPNGTVIYCGCRMDTMFDRVDNGRCLWYNLESPGRMTIRTMYCGRKEREHNLFRAVNDIRWMDEVICERDQGVLFVFRNVFSYMKPKEVGRFMGILYRRFQGCQVLFDCVSRKSQRRSRKSSTEYRRVRFMMRDPELGVNDWNPAYSLIRVREILGAVKVKKDWPGALKMKVRFAQRSSGRKLVAIRLGSEKYPTLEDKK